MRINSKTKLILKFLVIIIIILTSRNISDLTESQEKTVKETEAKEETETVTPKTANYWTLDEPIWIGMNEWQFYSNNYDWCSGDGSWSNPYLLENITIDAGGEMCGICIEWNTDYFIIRNCTVFNSDGSFDVCSAIRLIKIENGALIANNLSNNQRGGIYMDDCENITVSDNLLIDNVYHGVYITGSTTNNIFSKNIITGSFVGLRAYAWYNYFYYNYFANNTVQTIVLLEEINYFNNSIVGNYWDTYTGTDGNGDGIGDTAYTLSSGYDYLPICDNLDPNITINSPELSQLNGVTPPSFEVQIKEHFLESMWYTFDGGLTNTTFNSNGSIDQGVWDSLGNGTHTLEFYAEDFVHNIGNASIIINKDNIAPEVSIVEVSIQANKPPKYRISVEEFNFDTCWYTLDGGRTNWSFTSLEGDIDKTAWESVSDGMITLRFYARDKCGNEGYADILIIKYPYESENDNKNTDSDELTVLLFILGGTTIALGIVVLAGLFKVFYNKSKRKRFFYFDK